MSECDRTCGEALWDATDVARYLKASRSYVYKAVEAGTLPCIRIGSMLRFDPARIRAFALGSAAETTRILPFERRKR